MRRSNVFFGLVLFLCGVLLGSIMNPKTVTAQTQAEEKQVWMLQPIQKPANFDAYLFNTVTGDGFMLERNNKTPFKLNK